MIKNIPEGFIYQRAFTPQQYNLDPTTPSLELYTNNLQCFWWCEEWGFGWIS